MPWARKNGILEWQGEFDEPSDEELVEYGYIKTRTAKHLEADRNEARTLHLSGLSQAQIGRMLLLPERTIADMSQPCRTTQMTDARRLI
jgi:hypothetical protein